MGISDFIAIILAFLALYQAYNYNKSAKKLNADTSMLTREQIEREYKIISMIRELDDKLILIKNNEKPIRIGKDKLKIRKTSEFNPKKSKIVIDIVNNLDFCVKYKFIEDIKHFLVETGENEKEIPLRCELSQSESDKLVDLGSITYKYGVQLVHYKK